MRLLFRLEQGSRKPNRILWPISPPSSSYPSSPSSSSFSFSSSPSPTSSQSSPTDSPTSTPSSPPSPISYFDPFEQPKSPMSWTWTCHICNRSWRIGTTSRCLHCSHRMCMPEETKPASSSSRHKIFKPIFPDQPLSSLLAAEEQPVSADNPYVRRRPMLPLKRGAALGRHRYNQRLKRHFRRSRIRQDLKRKIRYCRSQFDYGGWEGWNEWRRDVKQFDALRRYEDEGSEDGDDTDDSVSTPGDEAEEDDDEDEDMDDGDTFKLVPATGRLHVVATSSSPGARKESKKPLEWNCWNDCDFPAHCIHARNERKMPEASLNRVFS
jgi:hypothetical protein